MRPLLLLACAVLATAAEDWERARILIPPLRPTPGEPVAVSRVDATLAVTGPNALTTLRVSVTNRGTQRAEAVVVLPIPPAAAVTRLDLTGPGGHLPGKLLPAAEARATYQSIVQRMRDPALAEFAGSALIRTSVFPVDPGQTQVVTLAWEELLAPAGDRVDWTLPRAERLDQGVPWTFAAEIRDPAVTGVLAPGRALDISRGKDGVWRVGDGGPNRTLAAGPLVLAWTRNPSGATVFAVPDGAEGGCFLLLAPAPARPGPALPRDVTIVIDRSGSMAGDTWRQTVAAVVQLIAGLNDGGVGADRLDLLVFNEGVDRFAAGPQPVTDGLRRDAETWLKALRPQGGTNLHAGLVEALRPAAAAGRLPLVLLMSDGLPTIGQTAESAIRALAEQDAGRRRIIALGIGADVNAPLLDALAAASRGRHRPIPPGGDVELAVADLGRALERPVLTDLRLEGGAGRLLDVEPRELPDLFAGDQLVVLGRYAGRAPVTLAVHAGGGPAAITATLDPAMASPAHAAVARLWAARRIATLMRRIRDLGADGRKDHPEVRELVTSVVDLSTTYGVMTEYTAFLAAEPVAAPAAALRDRAEATALEQMAKRAGLDALASSGNIQRLGEGSGLAVNDGYLDARYRTLPAAPVQLAGDRAAWRQGHRWTDPAAAGKAPTRTIQVGSSDWLALAERLRTRNRQALLAQDGEILLADGADIVLIHP